MRNLDSRCRGPRPIRSVRKLRNSMEFHTRALLEGMGRSYMPIPRHHQSVTTPVPCVGSPREDTHMSIADIECLATDLTINATLRAEAEKAFAASPATSVDGVIDFARAKGYSFTESELKEHAKAKIAGAGK